MVQNLGQGDEPIGVNSPKNKKDNKGKVFIFVSSFNSTSDQYNKNGT